MQGINMQGINMQGMTMQGIQLRRRDAVGRRARKRCASSAASWSPSTASNTLRGTALVGAHLLAEVRNLQVTPPATAVVDYRITAIAPELSQNDPTHTGNTFLYTLEQWVADTGSWQPACGPDADGRSVAIPLAATWDEHGDRVESNSLFTFGCTTGVIAKCYRWGYRPWVTGYGDLTAMHWTCTRLARADYCGDRRAAHAQRYDRSTSGTGCRARPDPAPRRSLGCRRSACCSRRAGTPSGAVCLSHSRWLLDDGPGIAELCPDRLVPPGLLGGTVCDTVVASPRPRLERADVQRGVPQPRRAVIRRAVID